jgi:ribosomal protein S18 acetylase RimI-like enzyme
MKYYGTEEPFYSLIVANNNKEALKLYREMYGDNDDPEQFKELSREEALYRISSAKTEDGDSLTYEEVKEDLDAKAPIMLLVDGDIL